MKVFICSPFKGDVPYNVAYARYMCRKAVEEGNLPVAPHLYYPQFMRDNRPEERERGQQWGLRDLEGCDEIWVCGPTITEGMKAEIDFAKEHNIPIVRKGETDGK